MSRKPKDADRPIHNRLVVLRAERDLSRLQLASAIGVNYQTIGYLERGDYSPSLELAFRLSEFFDLPIEAIFAREPFAPTSRNNIDPSTGDSMSTVATPAEQPDVVTWRDAVTPLSRASRQRWTIAYAILLALLASSVVGDTFAIERTGIQAVPLVLLVALAVVFGMLRRGTRRIAALDHPDLDERDVAARNSAYADRDAPHALAAAATSPPPGARLVAGGDVALTGATPVSTTRTTASGEASGVFVERRSGCRRLGLVGRRCGPCCSANGALSSARAPAPPSADPASAGGLPDALRDGACRRARSRAARRSSLAEATVEARADAVSHHRPRLRQVVRRLRDVRPDRSRVRRGPTGAMTGARRWARPTCAPRPASTTGLAPSRRTSPLWGGNIVVSTSRWMPSGARCGSRRIFTANSAVFVHLDRTDHPGALRAARTDPLTAAPSSPT